MDFGIEDKVALVCGSSRGLGRAVAEELAAEGVNLVLCARGAEALEATRDAIAADHGVRVLAHPDDLGDPAGVARLLDCAVDEYGRVDILVTNIGGPPAGRFESHTLAVWERAARENLLSVVSLCQAVVPGMRSRGWGRIINITSLAAKEPVDNLMLSNAMRAGVIGFAKSLANEVARDGITVNNALPGYTRTARLESLAAEVAAAKNSSQTQILAGWADSTPMGRIGEAREFAALVAFLASQRASYITGASIQVDGGRARSLL